MKLKLNLIFLIVYLVSTSLILKKIQYIPFGLVVLLFLLDKNIISEIKNLLYIIVALMPFLPMLAIFLVYLPFSTFGFVLRNPSFIKRFLFGFSIALFGTLVIYTILMFFSFSLNILSIVTIFFLPAAFMVYKQHKERGIRTLFAIKSKDYKIMIISLLLVFSITTVMFADDKLFISNGTYFYSKYYTIIKSVENYNTFPFYSPNAAQGEQLFLVDVPALFAHIAFIKILFPFIHPVLFWNYYSVFILLLTILSASLFIRIIISDKKEKISTYIAAIGGPAIFLSFVHIQLLESIKHFFALPIGFLIFVLVLSNPRKIEDLVIIASLHALAFLIHPAQSVGITLISLSLFIIIQFNKESIFRNPGRLKESIAKNKLKFIVLILILFLMPLFYILPAFYYSDLMRGTPFVLNDYPSNIISHFRAFFENNYISVKYPDLRRNDDRKLGLFFSAFGLIALSYSLLNLRKQHFKKANMFIFAFIMSTIISALIESLPLISNMEYGIRTLVYEPTLFVVLICVMINSFRFNTTRWILLAVLLAGFLHSLPYVKTNLANVHHENFIGGEIYRSEIDFIKNLSIDGRIITYGHFANAVDAGLHALTDRYLSRYEFKQLDTSKTVYEKIHSSNSWGDTPNLDKLPDVEFSNYLRRGGYKYIFLNVCHPIGNNVLKKIFPRSSYPVYQNQCNVFLVVNNSNYAEKVNVVSEEEEMEKKSKDDYYFYVSINEDLKWYKAEDYLKEYPRLEKAEPLMFERPKHYIAIINGDFNDNEWVVFKEQYFPRWKAYIGEKEVPVLSTNDDLILINTIEGNKIELKNVLLPIEKISGFLSSAGILLFIIFLIFSI